MSERLCRLDDLADPGSAAFVIRWLGLRQSLMVIRRGDRVFGYLNNCPHIGAPLDGQSGRFLDLTGCYIQCGMHGALFEPETGRCIGGPCAGKSLSPVPLSLDDGAIFVTVP